MWTNLTRWEQAVDMKMGECPSSPVMRTEVEGSKRCGTSYTPGRSATWKSMNGVSTLDGRNTVLTAKFFLQIGSLACHVCRPTAFKAQLRMSKSIFSNSGLIVLYSELDESKWYHSPHCRTPWLHDTEEHAASLASSQR